ncbi:MAG: YraN family protein, partial [Patescibacteria group bacterium]
MVDNKNTRKYGDRGEEYAVWFLKKRGYKVIERNFRSKVGEIDVIAVDPSTRSAKAQGRLERSRKATGHSTLRDKPLGSDSKSSGPDGTLAFVEVKTRWSKKYGKPEEAVTRRKLARIKR